MRVVLDTNILISGLLWYGPPRQLLDAARKGDLQLYTTQTLVNELEEVLLRRKFADRLDQANVTIETLIFGYASLAEVIEPIEIEPVVLDDPDDDAVLACAAAIDAQAIVSGDRHLLEIRDYLDIPILTAAELLGKL
jgi:putative PIN family toxin of toxin-antitoxin system